MDQLSDLVAKINEIHPLYYLGSVFLVALIGSPHCVSMCGVFCMASSNKSRYHTYLYHIGRLITYSVLGLLFSLLGETLVNSFQPFVFIAFITTFFVILLINSNKLKSKFAFLYKINARILKKVQNKSPGLQALIMGLASGTLPCGFLYMFLFAAISIQDTFLGTMTVLVFWLATIPALEVLVSVKSKVSGIKAFQKPIFRYALISVFFVYALGMSFKRVDYSHKKHQSMQHQEEEGHSCH